MCVSVCLCVEANITVSELVSQITLMTFMYTKLFFDSWGNQDAPKGGVRKTPSVTHLLQHEGSWGLGWESAARGFRGTCRESLPRAKDLRTGASRATAPCGWETLWRKGSWGPGRLRVDDKTGQTHKHNLCPQIQITLVCIDSLK